MSGRENPQPGRSAERQLAGFIDKYPPDLARQARTARRKMQARLSGAVELVYDNYNALVIGYGPNERPSDAVFSLVVNPGGWVTLCFLEGVHLPDPANLLRGSGNRVRHIRLSSPDDLDRPDVSALMAEAMKEADPQFDPGARRRLVIRSVSAKQRSRRGKGKGAAAKKAKRSKGRKAERLKG
jgi:hypothetical protein